QVDWLLLLSWSAVQGVRCVRPGFYGSARAASTDRPARRRFRGELSDRRRFDRLKGRNDPKRMMTMMTFASAARATQQALLGHIAGAGWVARIAALLRQVGP